MIKNPPIHVMLIEDDLAWQEILSDALSDFDVKVDVFTSLEDAMSALEEQDYQIAISDLSLSPGDPDNTDGFKALEALQKSKTPCASILLTGHGTIDVAVEALTRFNTYAFLQKETFSLSEFTSTIQRIITRYGNSDPKENA